MRLIFFLISLFVINSLFAQQVKPIRQGEFKASTLPAKYYRGTITAGKQWEDMNGQNLLVQTTDRKAGAGGDERHSLYAYHFIKSDTGWKQVFRVMDGVDDCGLDVRSEFIKNSTSITDLDKDGVPEISFAYALSCKGDVSPDELKFILYEGTQKYIIRGETTLIMNKQKVGGKKIVDKSFQSAPKAFLDFANAQWSKYGTEKPGE